MVESQTSLKVSLSLVSAPRTSADTWVGDVLRKVTCFT